MATRTLRLAHRGDWRHAPENSLAAFAAALAIPACDGLEFDVRLAADGVLVTSHDDTLQRTHGRPDRVDALSAEACEALGVPSLADVLGLAGRQPFLDVELKGDPGPTIVAVLAAARGPDLANAVVSSFEAVALERVAHLAPAWPRWLNAHSLTDADIATAIGLGCWGVAAQWRALDPRSVAKAQAAGLEVASWTVRRRPTFDRLARLGVVAVCVEANALDG